MKKGVCGPFLLLTFLCVMFAALFYFEKKNDTPSNASADNTPGTFSEEEEYYNNNTASDGVDMNHIPDTAGGLSTPPSRLTTIPVDTDTESIRILVNHKYKLSKDYVPKDLVVPAIRFANYGTLEKNHLRAEAAMWIEKLFDAAASENIILIGVSGYRSYSRQEQIYSSNVLNRGEATTNRVSAKPGTSEHQTGLVMDVSCSSVGGDLIQSFSKTPEGKWLAKNCYKYGFIIRYAKGKEDITGYIYEPWHIRYVGKNLAKYLYENELTLEEYYADTLIDDSIPADKGRKKAVSKYLKAKLATPAPTDNSSTYIPQERNTPEPKITPAPSKKPEKTKKPSETKAPVESPDAEDEDTDTSPEPPEATATPDAAAQPQDTPPADSAQPQDTAAPAAMEDTSETTDATE